MYSRLRRHSRPTLACKTRAGVQISPSWHEHGWAWVGSMLISSLSCLHCPRPQTSWCNIEPDRAPHRIVYHLVRVATMSLATRLTICAAPC